MAPRDSPQLAEERKRLRVDQVRCAQRVLREVATQIGDEVILIAFVDHGAVSLAQLARPPETWTEADKTDRFGIFFATDANRCGLTEVESLVNVGRRLLGCLAREPVDAIEDRYFINTYHHDALVETAEP